MVFFSDKVSSISASHMLNRAVGRHDLFYRSAMCFTEPLIDTMYFWNHSHNAQVLSNTNTPIARRMYS